MLLHSLNKLDLRELLILVDVADGDDLSHSLGHVHIACVHTQLNEECHHTEQFLNADIAITILIKQFEHLCQVLIHRTIREPKEKHRNSEHGNCPISLLHIPQLFC